MATTFEQFLINLALDYYIGNTDKRDINIDVPLVTLDDEFPTKDREKSRRSNKGRRKSKEKRKRNMNHDYRMYNGDLDKNGNIAKNRRKVNAMKAELKSYLNPEPAKKTDMESYIDFDEWCLESLEDVEYAKLYNFEPTMERLERENIILISPRADYIREKIRRYDRKAIIDDDMKIVGYSIVSPSNQVIATFPTELKAMSVAERFIKGYDVVPVKVYTKEQEREIEELGFIPVPGFKTIMSIN